MKVRLAEKKN